MRNDLCSFVGIFSLKSKSAIRRITYIQSAAQKHRQKGKVGNERTRIDTRRASTPILMNMYAAVASQRYTQPRGELAQAPQPTTLFQLTCKKYYSSYICGHYIPAFGYVLIVIILIILIIYLKCLSKHYISFISTRHFRRKKKKTFSRSNNIIKLKLVKTMFLFLYIVKCKHNYSQKHHYYV